MPMTPEQAINVELERLDLSPLNQEQVQCLSAADQIDDAAGMLQDLRDRCQVRLPLPRGTTIGGPFASEDEAVEYGKDVAASHLLVAVDEMATDESRSGSSHNEFYVTGFSGQDAAVALAERDHWLGCWVAGRERVG
jgi:N-methylhydantoinase A/oxoprolinase/acetone carboxylase beta subunit